MLHYKSCKLFGMKVFKRLKCVHYPESNSKLNPDQTESLTLTLISILILVQSEHKKTFESRKREQTIGGGKNRTRVWGTARFLE